MSRKAFSRPILAQLYDLAGALGLIVGVLGGLGAMKASGSPVPIIVGTVSGIGVLIVLVGIGQVITAIAKAAYHAEGTELSVNALLPTLIEINERLSALVVNNVASPGTRQMDESIRREVASALVASKLSSSPGGAAPQSTEKDAIPCPNCGDDLIDAGNGKMRCTACNQKYVIER
jgi:hypothetical protein